MFKKLLLLICALGTFQILASSCGDDEPVVLEDPGDCPGASDADLRGLAAKCIIGGATVEGACRCRCAGGEYLDITEYKTKSCPPLGQYEILDALAQGLDSSATVVEDLSQAEELAKGDPTGGGLPDPLAGGPGTGPNGTSDDNGNSDAVFSPDVANNSPSPDSLSATAGNGKIPPPTGGDSNKAGGGNATHGIVTGGGVGTAGPGLVVKLQGGGGGGTKEVNVDLGYKVGEGTPDKAAEDAADAAVKGASGATQVFGSAGLGGGGGGRSTAGTTGEVSIKGGATRLIGEAGVEPNKALSIFELVRPHYVAWSKTLE